jgi:hypothetical protein
MKDRKTEWENNRKTERQKDRKTERQKDRKTERQKDRKTERQNIAYLVDFLIGKCLKWLSASRETWKGSNNPSSSIHSYSHLFTRQYREMCKYKKLK